MVSVLWVVDWCCVQKCFDCLFCLNYVKSLESLFLIEGDDIGLGLDNWGEFELMD